MRKLGRLTAAVTAGSIGCTTGGPPPDRAEKARNEPAAVFEGRSELRKNDAVVVRLKNGRVHRGRFLGVFHRTRDDYRKEYEARRRKWAPLAPEYGSTVRVERVEIGKKGEAEFVFRGFDHHSVVLQDPKTRRSRVVPLTSIAKLTMRPSELSYDRAGIDRLHADLPHTVVLHVEEGSKRNAFSASDIASLERTESDSSATALVIVFGGIVAFATTVAVVGLSQNNKDTDKTGGRPFRVRGRKHTARVTSNSEWCSRHRPRPSRLSRPARNALAKLWMKAALDEHASVAAFSKLSLELLALGAPPRLIAETHRAALDEVNHAQMCFALASAHSGKSLGPTPLAQSTDAHSTPTWVELAVGSFLDGCLGESLSADICRAGLREARDRATRRALAVMVRDEARHAALGWKLVAYAIERDPIRVRAGLRKAMRTVRRDAVMDPSSAAERWPLVRAYGMIDGTSAAADVTRRTTTRVLNRLDRLLGVTKDEP